MDKTLTPSPWTTYMDYLYGLPKWTTPENHLEGEKQLFQALNKFFYTYLSLLLEKLFNTIDTWFWAPFLR